MGVVDIPMFAEDGAVLPYAGTSGWSGSATSRARAESADRSGETSERQQGTLRRLAWAGSQGLTWKELGEAMGWHHGTASGVLSVLHKEGRIARLSVVRDRCKVYVHLDHVGDREVEGHGRKSRPCSKCGHVEGT